MSNSESTAPERKNWSQALAVYLEPRQFIILVMGFSSGLPLLLTLSTLSYWLSTADVDKTTIGLFALVQTPYAYKFLWSPVVDRLRLPILGRMGRRRSWLLLTQIFLAASVFVMGQIDPVQHAAWTALAAIVVAFFSASQDIVIDAYRIELLNPEEQGAGAGSTQVGYRLGMLLAGAGATAMSDYTSWSMVYAVMAAAVLACAIITVFLPEPKVLDSADDRPSRVRSRRSGDVAGYSEFLQTAVIEPFKDFITRRGWLVILAFILFYKFGEAFGGAMANPFYHEMKFSGTEIAVVSKVYGVIATLIGGVLGGVLVARLGLFRTLFLGGILQALTILLMSVIAWRGGVLDQLLAGDHLASRSPAFITASYARQHGELLRWLMAAITAENITSGIASAALVAYLSGLCNTAFTATQYALFSSLMANGRTIMSGGSGWLIDHLHNDWASFWVITVFMAIPGLVFLLWITRIYPDEKHLVPATSTS
jgi:PAT family beta-lactamase induction signal transducer AmpG